jgi:hypothetical protein
MTAPGHKKIEDEPLKRILEKGMYYVPSSFTNHPYGCSLCGSGFQGRVDVLEHIINFHMDDVLPEAYPDENRNIIKESDQPSIDPDDLELL